jgi:hypothetical protein
VKVRLVAIGVALAALGCNRSATGPQPGVSSSCTVTLSGALSGTYDCRPATTTWSNIDNTGAFTFAVYASGSRPAISVPIAWDSEPAPRTYSNTDLLAQADIAVTSAANQIWRATVGTGAAATGSYSLTFTSIVANLNGPSGKGYSTEGTLTATLTPVAASGATGTLTLTATF